MSKIFPEVPLFTKIFVIFDKESSLTEDDFKEHFGKYGKIRKTNMTISSSDRNLTRKRQRGIIYIDFAKTSEAVRAMEEMNGQMIGDVSRPLIVHLASEKNDNLEIDVDKDLMLQRLCVKHHKNQEESEIKEHFSQFGNLVWMACLKNNKTGQYKGVAFLKYEKQSETATALEECDPKYKPRWADVRKAVGGQPNPGGFGGGFGGPEEDNFQGGRRGPGFPDDKNFQQRGRRGPGFSDDINYPGPRGPRFPKDENFQQGSRRGSGFQEEDNFQGGRRGTGFPGDNFPGNRMDRGGPMPLMPAPGVDQPEPLINDGRFKDDRWGSGPRSLLDDPFPRDGNHDQRFPNEGDGFGNQMFKMGGANNQAMDSGPRRLEAMVPPSLTKQQIFRIFDIAQGLENFSINASSGLVTVEYENAAAAAHAKEKIDGLDVFGNPIAVRYAKQKNAIEETAMQLKQTITDLQLVGNRKPDLENIMKSIRQVTNVLGFGENPDQNMVENFQNRGDEEVLSWCSIPLPSRKRLAPQHARSACVLFFKTRPSMVNIEMLNNAFSRFGDFIFCSYTEGKPHGLAHFASREAGQDCLRTMNNVFLAGNKLMLDFAKENQEFGDDSSGRKRMRVY